MLQPKMEIKDKETLARIWSKKNKDLFDQMTRFEEGYTCTKCNKKGCSHMLKEKAKLFGDKANTAIEQLFVSKLIIDKLR